MNDLPKSADRVRKAAEALGLAIEIVEMATPTRTVAEAAAACGCPAGAIVKSLVFKGRQSDRPYLLLVSGANRVDERMPVATPGETLVRPDASYVRTLTGFAIGGVPPGGDTKVDILRREGATSRHDRVAGGGRRQEPLCLTR